LSADHIQPLPVSQLPKRPPEYRPASSRPHQRRHNGRSSGSTTSSTTTTSSRRHDDNASSKGGDNNDSDDDDDEKQDDDANPPPPHLEPSPWLQQLITTADAAEPFFHNADGSFIRWPTTSCTIRGMYAYLRARARAAGPELLLAFDAACVATDVASVLVVLLRRGLTASQLDLLFNDACRALVLSTTPLHRPDSLQRDGVPQEYCGEGPPPPFQTVHYTVGLVFVRVPWSETHLGQIRPEQASALLRSELRRHQVFGDHAAHGQRPRALFQHTRSHFAGGTRSGVSKYTTVLVRVFADSGATGTNFVVADLLLYLFPCLKVERLARRQSIKTGGGTVYCNYSVKIDVLTPTDDFTVVFQVAPTSGTMPDSCALLLSNQTAHGLGISVDALMQDASQNGPMLMPFQCQPLPQRGANIHAGTIMTVSHRWVFHPRYCDHAVFGDIDLQTDALARLRRHMIMILLRDPDETKLLFSSAGAPQVHSPCLPAAVAPRPQHHARHRGRLWRLPRCHAAQRHALRPCRPRAVRYAPPSMVLAHLHAAAQLPALPPGSRSA